MPDELLPRGDWKLFFECCSLHVLRCNGCRAAAKLDFAFPQARRWTIRQSLTDVVKARLLTAGTRIQYEDFHDLTEPSRSWRLTSREQLFKNDDLFLPLQPQSKMSPLPNHNDP